MTSLEADVAALLKITDSESATLDALDGCVQQLRDIQAARRALARVPAATLLPWPVSVSLAFRVPLR